MSFVGSLRLSRPTVLAFAGLGFLWGAFAAQVPVLKAHLGVDDGLFGMALLGTALGALLAMWVAPKFDHAVGARAMQVAALMLCAAFLLPGLAPTLGLFAAAMFLCGASSGLLDVVMNARVTRIEAEHSTALMSLNHSVFSFAYGTSAFLTGFAREVGAMPVIVFAAIGVYVVILSFLMVSPAPADGPRDRESPYADYVRVAIFTGLITLVAFMTEQSTESWSALHIERTLGGGAAEGAFGPTLLGLMMGIGRLAGHFATPRGRERQSIVGASLVTAAGAATAALAPTQAIAYLGFALLGLGVSIVAPLAGQIVDPEDRAMAVSRTVMIGYVGFFIGPPLMGFVADAHSLRASYLVMACLMLIAPLCLLPLRGRKPRLVRSSPLESLPE